MEDLTKLAAAAIKQLQTENKELKDELGRAQEATKLAFDLYHSGMIAVEQLEDKITEFKSKDVSELEVIRKASEFSKTASAMNSFKLSSTTNFDRQKPEDRFVSFLLEDI